MRQKHKITRLFIATLIAINSLTSSIRANDLSRDSDEFGNYAGGSAQFKDSTEKLEYLDIISMLQTSNESVQAYDLQTIFANRVTTSKDNLPTTDDESQADNASNVSSNASGYSADLSGLTQTPGEFQGTWNGKSTEEIYAEASITGISETLFNKLKAAAGQAVYFDDRVNYKIQVPHYSQWSGAGEAWEGLYYGTLNIRNVGCAIYMMAHISTVLQGKVINPAEATILCAKYGVIDSSGSFANSESGINSFMNTMGYKAESYTLTEVKSNKEQLKQDVIDSVSQGIPCGIRTTSTYSPINDSESHYLNIDYYDSSSDSFILAQAATKARDTQEFSWDQIVSALYPSGRICLIVVSKS